MTPPGGPAREDLDNPPLLVVSDLDRFEVYRDDARERRGRQVAHFLDRATFSVLRFTASRTGITFV